MKKKENSLYNTLFVSQQTSIRKFMTRGKWMENKINYIFEAVNVDPFSTTAIFTEAVSFSHWKTANLCIFSAKKRRIERKAIDRCS
jgi:hypothetical protein